MDARELRIGNLIGMNLKEFPENYFRVLEPAQKSMKVTDCWVKDIDRMETDFYDADLMEGIELTPEWLHRLGFKHQRDSLYSIDFDGKVLIGYWLADGATNIGEFIPKNIKYVNEMQNLFWILTYKELTINPLTP